MIHIIGEAATNHFGSMDKGMELIDIAVDSGVDSIKLQLVHNEEVYLPGNYEYGTYDIDEVRKSRKKSQLNKKQLQELNRYAVKKHIKLTAAPFGVKSLRLLMSIDPAYIKVASGDMNNFELISHYAACSRKLIISTGMSTLYDVETLVNYLKKIRFDDYVLMHCIAIYPHEEIDSQLGYIRTLMNRFDCEVGFSDHTLGVAAAAAAIAMGVKYIEKHYTIDRELGGLDAKHSLERSELKNYVNTLRAIDSSLSVNERSISERERYTRKRARRGIYAAKKLKKNQILKSDDIVCLRPETEMPANLFLSLVGEKICQDIEPFEPIIEKMFYAS
jgi:N,N'-diacetyllegionaminate synthase